MGPLTGCPRRGGIGLARFARSTRRILTTVTTRRKRVGHIRENGIQRVEGFGDTKGPPYLDPLKIRGHEIIEEETDRATTSLDRDKKSAPYSNTGINSEDPIGQLSIGRDSR